jgi:hypothetical protein
MNGSYLHERLFRLTFRISSRQTRHLNEKRNITTVNPQVTPYKGSTERKREQIQKMFTFNFFKNGKD